MAHPPTAHTRTPVHPDTCTAGDKQTSILFPLPRQASTNPFKIPEDEEIFRHREEEKQRKTEARTTALNAPVAVKSTFASRMQATTTDEARELLRDLKMPKGTYKPDITVAAASAAPERRKEKENMSDFIAKKREIFLLQVWT